MAKSKTNKPHDKRVPLIERGAFPALILSLIAIVCVALLALTSTITAQAREEQRRLLEDEHKRAIFPDASEFITEQPDAAGAELPEAKAVDLTETAPDVSEVYTVKENGETTGVIFALSSPGYKGADPLTLMVGYTLDGTLKALTVDTATQTRGIGDKVGKPDFLTQFDGLAADGDVTVDAISGATQSSSGVINGVKEANAAFVALNGQ